MKPVEVRLFLEALWCWGLQLSAQRSLGLRVSSGSVKRCTGRYVPRAILMDLVCGLPNPLV